MNHKNNKIDKMDKFFDAISMSVYKKTETFLKKLDPKLYNDYKKCLVKNCNYKKEDSLKKLSNLMKFMYDCKKKNGKNSGKKCKQLYKKTNDYKNNQTKVKCAKKNCKKTLDKLSKKVPKEHKQMLH